MAWNGTMFGSADCGDQLRAPGMSIRAGHRGKESQLGILGPGRDL